MRFKNFTQFLEGARWNSDKSGALISLNDHPDDLLRTSINKFTEKTSGFGKYIFKVFYGLESTVEVKKTNLENEYSDFMQMIKYGYFNMIGDREPVYKMTVNDIAKGKFEDLSQYDQQQFFEFMKKTGNIDVDNLKYIVMAESKDKLVSWMAEALKKFTRAKVIKLSKKKYENEEILGIYRKIPQIVANRPELTKFQNEILKSYTEYVSKNEDIKKRRESGEIDSFERYLEAFGLAGSGARFIQNVMRHMERKGSIVIQGNSLFNNVRSYLNFKYDFDEDFISKIKECLVSGSSSKMIIIDDNLQHGNDFREIMQMCGYVADSLIVSGKTTVQAFKKTEKIRKKLETAINPTQKKTLEKAYEEAQILEKCNLKNITGYVLYKRPVLASSNRLDIRQESLNILEKDIKALELGWTADSSSGLFAATFLKFFTEAVPYGILDESYQPKPTFHHYFLEMGKNFFDAKDFYSIEEFERAYGGKAVKVEKSTGLEKGKTADDYSDLPEWKEDLLIARKIKKSKLGNT